MFADTNIFAILRTANVDVVNTTGMHSMHDFSNIRLHIHVANAYFLRQSFDLVCFLPFFVSEMDVQQHVEAHSIHVCRD